MTRPKGRVAELGLERLDFSKEDAFPPEIQKMLGCPERYKDEDVLRFLLRQSEICRILRKNPADFEMLDAVYFGEFVRVDPHTNGVDRFLANSLSGQALRDRLDVIPRMTADILRPRLEDGETVKVLDLGAGPGPYAFPTIALLGEFAKQLQWECVDIDRLALDLGAFRAKDLGLERIITFRRANFMSRNSFPAPGDEADFGLLVGILCSMTMEESVACLKKVRPHFKAGAEVIVPTLALQAFLEDKLTFRVLCNVLGWELRPKTIEEVEEVFSEAGYKKIGIYSERDNGTGQYAIVHARI